MAIKDVILTFSYAVLIVLLSIFVYFFTNMQKHPEQIFSKMGYVDESGSIKPGTILQVVHLDLKGMPPTMNYLKELIGRLSLHNVGIDALLIDYGEMFPYDGSLAKISSKFHFTKKEITDFLDDCYLNGFEVIPLVQTFGDMEFILQLEEFQHLREDPNNPDIICPSDPGSLDLIKELVTQVLDFHVASHAKPKRIHIGFDEVSTMNKCSRCLERNTNRSEILFSHMSAVATFIRDRYENTISTLVWEDLLRAESQNDVCNSKLTNTVEIVFRDYALESESEIDADAWHKYDCFEKIWAAGAFKGVDRGGLLPSLQNRHDNHNRWMEFLKKLPSSDKVVGFISTGKSLCRNTEFCELLTVSIPSLVLNSLRVTKTLKQPSHFDIIGELKTIFKCGIQDIIGWDHLDELQHCKFEESNIMMRVSTLETLQPLIIDVYKEVFGPMGMREEVFGRKFPTDAFINVYGRTTSGKLKLITALETYYHKDMVKKWMDIHFQPYWKKLTALYAVHKNEISSHMSPQKGDALNIAIEA